MKKIFLLFLPLFFLFSCDKGDPVKLQFNLNEGDKYMLTFSMDMDSKMQKIYMKADVLFNCLSRKDDEMEVDVVYDKMIMDMEMMGRSISFDSENPNGKNEQDRMMYEVLAPMINTSLIHTFNTRGQVLNFPDYDAIFEDSPLMQQQMKEMESQMGQMVVEFPKEDKYVGDSWNANIKRNSQGVKLTFNVEYTLKKVDDEFIYISLDGKLNSDAKMKGSLNGLMTLYKESCFIKESTATLKMEAGGMSIPVKYSFESKQLN